MVAGYNRHDVTSSRFSLRSTGRLDGAYACRDAGARRGACAELTARSAGQGWAGLGGWAAGRLGGLPDTNTHTVCPHGVLEQRRASRIWRRLARWLAKIHERDFFPDEHRQQPAAMVARGRDVLNGFPQAVYIAEGVPEAAGGATQEPCATGVIHRAIHLPPPIFLTIRRPGPLTPSRRPGALVTSQQDLADHSPNRNNYRPSPAWPHGPGRGARPPITAVFRNLQVPRHLRRKGLAINFQGFGSVRALEPDKTRIWRILKFWPCGRSTVMHRERHSGLPHGGGLNAQRASVRMAPAR